MAEKDAEARALLRRYVDQRVAAGEDAVLLPASEGRPADITDSAEASTARVAAVDPSTPAAGVASGAAAGTDSLARIATEVRACTRCRLHETRTHAVPGVGPDNADVVFVGEGPGADEDAQGEPFVGRAGQLLTKIIESVQLDRRDVFITNIVKCRPPGNRDPERDEIAACEPFLKRQLACLAPAVICALGRHAANTLLQSDASMASLRAGTHHYEGVRLFPTYHPAACLRNPQWKRPVWEDIQKLRRAYDERPEKPAPPAERQR